MSIKSVVIVLLVIVNLCWFATLACADVDEKTIYLSDDRMEVFEADTELQQVARSVGMLVARNKLERLENGDYKLRPQTLAKRFDLCPHERYADQPSAGFCTVILTGEDQVLTASHCLKLRVGGEIKSAEDAAVIFAYQYNNRQTTPDVIPSENIYFLTKNLKKSKRIYDWGLWQLDRPVKSQQAITIASKLPALNTEVFMVGHPRGLPQKVAIGQVYKLEGEFFLTDLDAFEGNSGSPLFIYDENGLPQWAGLLLSGGDDLVLDEKRACNKLHRCEGVDTDSFSCGGERALSSLSIFEGLN